MTAKAPIDWTKPIQYVPLDVSRLPYDLTFVGKHDGRNVCWNPVDHRYYSYTGAECNIRNKPPEPVLLTRWLVMRKLNGNPYCETWDTIPPAGLIELYAVKKVQICEGD